ncbi:MAG: PIN domain-containing protein [Candidatus Binatia bacterium]
MSDKVLVDTNVLVYAYDRTAPLKQRRALEVLDRLVATSSGVLTTQVLAEFFVTVTRKITKPLPTDEAESRVHNLARAWPIIELTGMIILEAARGVREHHFSYWDAQIWATAKLNQIPVVLSEDFSDGQTTEGIRFMNPFSAKFQLSSV